MKRRTVGELAKLQISVILLRDLNSSLSPSTNNPFRTFVDHHLPLSTNCLICCRLWSAELPRMSIDTIDGGASTLIDSCRTHNRSQSILTTVLQLTRTIMTSACLTLLSEQAGQLNCREPRKKEAIIISNLWRNVSCPILIKYRKSCVCMCSWCHVVHTSGEGAKSRRNTLVIYKCVITCLAKCPHWKYHTTVDSDNDLYFKDNSFLMICWLIFLWLDFYWHSTWQ